MGGGGKLRAIEIVERNKIQIKAQAKRNFGDLIEALLSVDPFVNPGSQCSAVLYTKAAAYKSKSTIVPIV